MKDNDGFWSGFHDAIEVKLTLICTVIFLATVTLGVLTYYLGISILTVEFTVHFDVALGFILIAVGISSAWIFATWYLCRITGVIVERVREEVETPHPLWENKGKVKD